MQLQHVTLLCCTLRLCAYEQRMCICQPMCIQDDGTYHKVWLWTPKCANHLSNWRPRHIKWVHLCLDASTQVAHAFLLFGDRIAHGLPQVRRPWQITGSGHLAVGWGAMVLRNSCRVTLRCSKVWCLEHQGIPMQCWPTQSHSRIGGMKFNLDIFILIAFTWIVIPRGHLQNVMGIDLPRIVWESGIRDVWEVKFNRFGGAQWLSKPIYLFIVFCWGWFPITNGEHFEMDLY